jgi:hypothetical protein
VHFPGSPILQRTGELVGSLTNPSHPMAVHVEGRKSLTLGTRVKYAPYHQRGTKRMPQRREVMFTEAFKRTTMHHLQAYLVQVATQSGFRHGLTPITAAKLGALASARSALRG